MSIVSQSSKTDSKGFLVKMKNFVKLKLQKMNKLEKAFHFLYGFDREKVSLEKALPLLSNNDPVSKVFFYFVNYENYKNFQKNITGQDYYQLKNNKDDYSQLALAYCYEYGLGTRQNLKAAFDLYYKLSLKENPLAQFNLGWFYHHGLETEKSGVKAMCWYLKAAEKGHSLAQFSLGCYLMISNNGLVDADVHLWILKAAIQGYGPACEMISDFYKNGLHGDADVKLAVYWLTQSVPENTRGAMVKLSQYYPDRIVRSPQPEEKSNSAKVDMSCCVCASKNRNAVCVPCNHMSTCFECIKKIEAKGCPICRNKIKQVIKVFL